MISANKGKEKKLYDKNIQNDLFITLYKGMIQKTCRLYHLYLIAKVENIICILPLSICYWHLIKIEILTFIQ